MKKTILILTLGLLQLSAIAKEKVTKTPASKTTTSTNWVVDASHSNVKFTVSHLVISTVEGYFKTFNGSATATTNDFTNANIAFAVDVNSVNTDNETRDKHLKSDDFFNAEKVS